MGISRLCYYGSIKVGSCDLFYDMGVFVVGYAGTGKLRWHITKRGTPTGIYNAHRRTKVYPSKTDQTKCYFFVTAYSLLILFL